MKFHALSLCLAGTLIAGAAWAQDQKDAKRMHDDRMHSDQMRTDERVDHSTWPYYRETFTGNRQWRSRTYTQQFPFYNEDAWTYGPVTETPQRIAYYPDLPSLGEVASKVAEIQAKNAQAAADYRSMADKARGMGWTNIATVYDQIATDHSRGADMASTWLASNNFPAPAAPATPVTMLAADVNSETDLRNSIDRAIDMHAREYTETVDKLHNEKSSTVRGMYLMNLATIQAHISLLRSLDRDVTHDRKDLSARLQSQLDGTRLAHSQTEWDNMIIEEEWASLMASQPATEVAAVPYTVPGDTEIRIVEKPVIVERIVERPVPAPAPAPAVVTPPAIVQTQPQIQPAPRATVAGARQVRSRRARRPAK